MKEILLLLNREPEKFFIYEERFKRERWAMFAMSSFKNVLDYAALDDPDLILFDLNYAGEAQKGLDFLKEFKASQRYRHIPIIVLADADDEDLRRKVKKLGIEDYAVKSQTDTEELVRRIKGVLPTEPEA